ncbi:HAMP domain-containing histidine kinase [Brevibacillus ruminantium]|uniref:histidine kinase n=1 Tax=Brevibacillus ruminantium TaxID=2950604 RepID=A0ABY4WAD5_9BACL|nr:HAMP domain-containing sensor histidine kinase [Brevibacillus ruminantium]USG63734.1 HAMP domain-containing histidine kinase [Brevibacillus ruminantium]
MSRLRRRLAAHFTIQFFFLWLFVTVIMTVLLLVLLQYLVNQDLKKTFPRGALDNIVAETKIQNGDLSIPVWWREQLSASGYWLQIVNEEGKVIFATSGAPEKSSYHAAELLGMAETGRHDSFRVTTKLDKEKTTYPQPLMYILGTEGRDLDRLKTWFQSYAEKGMIRSDAIPELEHELEKGYEYVQVIDARGNILQSVGDSDRKEPYRPLELIEIYSEPGTFSTNMYTYLDQETGHVWLLHTQKKGEGYSDQPIMSDAILVLSVTGCILLILAFLLASWHGIRYSQPLLLFADWFERMGQGRYHEALTEKEKKKVFRKNGSIRLRYRLYKEVIAGFYEMASRLAATESERARLEKTREEWMTGISHDLRTPLSTVQGYGHLLESGQYSWSKEELQGMGKMIREKGDYMLALLQDFSLVFQLKNQALSFPLEKLEINEFVRRTVLRYVNDVTLSDVSFAFESDPRQTFIRSNAKWLQRVLDNLIGNGVKHNPAGTRITIKTGRDEREAVILVEDNGIGMDEETKRNLFDRYYRGTATEEGTDGAGLGMSIAKAIVLAHQGKIEVESKAGEGTRIRLRFPLMEEENDRDVSTSQSETA